MGWAETHSRHIRFRGHYNHLELESQIKTAPHLDQSQPRLMILIRALCKTVARPEEVQFLNSMNNCLLNNYITNLTKYQEEVIPPLTNVGISTNFDWRGFRLPTTRLFWEKGVNRSMLRL